MTKDAQDVLVSIEVRSSLSAWPNVRSPRLVRHGRMVTRIVAKYDLTTSQITVGSCDFLLSPTKTLDRKLIETVIDL
jgi:hypothetical protein